MLAILNELSKHCDPETDTFGLGAFKIVYVAPMKALVQEMVSNFTSLLTSFGIKVGELTGDSQMNKAQIAETQIIMTTPEKWDANQLIRAIQTSLDSSSLTRSTFYTTSEAQ